MEYTLNVDFTTDDPAEAETLHRLISLLAERWVENVELTWTAYNGDSQ